LFSRIGELFVRSRVAALVLLGIAMAGCAPTKANVIVSLEFDDTHVSQLAALPLLAKYDMRGTFFVNSIRLGDGDKYLTVQDVLAMAKAGHEIGGHTLNHPRLPDLPREEQLREVCEDREKLRQLGLVIDNFAYPSGAYDSTTESVVAACGYTSARTTGGLCETPWFFQSCDRAETVLPPQFFATRTHGSIRRERISDRMRALVTDAESHGGGWVQIIFHHICDHCNDYSITEEELGDFLSWLAKERIEGRVQVRTVREVMRGGKGNDAPQWVYPNAL
jgi:hypothetical protein